jgi:cytochrome b
LRIADWGLIGELKFNNLDQFEGSKKKSVTGPFTIADCGLRIADWGLIGELKFNNLDQHSRAVKKNR